MSISRSFASVPCNQGYPQFEFVENIKELTQKKLDCDATEINLPRRGVILGWQDTQARYESLVSEATHTFADISEPYKSQLIKDAVKNWGGMRGIYKPIDFSEAQVLAELDEASQKLWEEGLDCTANDAEKLRDALSEPKLKWLSKNCNHFVTGLRELKSNLINFTKTSALGENKYQLVNGFAELHPLFIHTLLLILGELPVVENLDWQTSKLSKASSLDSSLRTLNVAGNILRTFNPKRCSAWGLWPRTAFSLVSFIDIQLQLRLDAEKNNFWPQSNNTTYDNLRFGDTIQFTKWGICGPVIGNQGGVTLPIGSTDRTLINFYRSIQ